MPRVWNKLLGLVLIPAFLVTQLICMCASPASASSHPSSDEAEHGCCNDDDGDDSSSAPAHEPHKHDPTCSHCTSEGQAQTVERADVGITAPQPIAFAPILVPLLKALDHIETVRYRAFAVWLTDPSPPPNLLRVKCSLQI
jgi:hypothetical protein